MAKYIRGLKVSGATEYRLLNAKAPASGTYQPIITDETIYAVQDASGDGDINIQLDSEELKAKLTPGVVYHFTVAAYRDSDMIDVFSNTIDWSI